MSEHTPGPWEAKQRGVAHRISGSRVGEFAEVVVDGYETEAATACLIAAAPELLEAAKEVLERSAGSPDFIAIDGLRRAVAKAEISATGTFERSNGG